MISHEKFAEEVSAILLDAVSPLPEAVDKFFDEPSQVADYRAGVSSGVPSVEATDHCSALLLCAASAEARHSVACTVMQQQSECSDEQALRCTLLFYAKCLIHIIYM